MTSDAKQIPLGNDRFAIVDPDIFEALSHLRWKVRPRKNERTVYAYRWADGREVLMHRVIMNAAPGQVVDHKNRNGLDNRRENLRFATNTQNRANSPPHLRNTSGYKGVYKTPSGRWEVRIGDHGRQRYIGTYPTPQEAALQYDRAARETHGEFAYLNYPDES